MTETKQDYISALSSRFDELTNEISAEKEKAQRILDGIQDTEKQMEYLVRLLDAEGVSLDGRGEEFLTQRSLADIAYEELDKRPEKEPIHYKELANLILANGHQIPGKNPAANLITHIGRDTRFVRTGRGIYGLTEWGVKPMKRRTRRRRKKKL